MIRPCLPSSFPATPAATSLPAQLITALNMNKTFYLPGNFCIMETGNSPGSAMKRDGIGDRIQAFADTILETMRDGESRKER